MSRVGKQPIAVPEKVTVSIEDGKVKVEGPLGRLDHVLPGGITCEQDADGKRLVVRRDAESKPFRELHGLTRTLVHNMVIGVTEGYKKELEVSGIGYSVRAEGKALSLQVGFANTIRLEIPETVKVEVLQPTNPGRVVVSGCDKQQVGQFAARIRAVRPAEPYQGKGIKYAGEQIRRKAGKAFVGTGS